MENWSLPALIPLAFVTGLHGEEGRTPQGSKNSGKPTGGCWQLPLSWRNALKDSAGPPPGHCQMFTANARAETDQEEDHRGRVAGAVGPCQGEATNLSPLHRVQMAPIDGPLSWIQEQHRKISRLLLILTWDLCQTWGQTLRTSYSSQLPCRGRAILLKDHGQNITKTGSSGGGA